MAQYGINITPLAFQKLGLMKDPEEEKRKREEAAALQNQADFAALARPFSAEAQPPAPLDVEGFDPVIGQQAVTRAGVLAPEFQGAAGRQLTGGQYLDVIRRLDAKDRDAFDDALRRAKNNIIIDKQSIDEQLPILQPTLRQIFKQEEAPKEFKTINDAILDPEGYEAVYGPGSYAKLVERYSGVYRKPDKDTSDADRQKAEDRQRKLDKEKRSERVALIEAKIEALGSDPKYQEPDPSDKTKMRYTADYFKEVARLQQQKIATLEGTDPALRSDPSIEFPNTSPVPMVGGGAPQVATPEITPATPPTPTVPQGNDLTPEEEMELQYRLRLKQQGGQ